MMIPFETGVLIFNHRVGVMENRGFERGQQISSSSLRVWPPPCRWARGTTECVPCSAASSPPSSSSRSYSSPPFSSLPPPPILSYLSSGADHISLSLYVCISCSVISYLASQQVFLAGGTRHLERATGRGVEGVQLVEEFFFTWSGSFPDLDPSLGWG